MKDEFFGNDDQRAILRRSRRSAALLRQDRRYSYYGRAVGLPEQEDGGIDHLAALAVVQGGATYGGVPHDRGTPQTYTKPFRRSFFDIPMTFVIDRRGNLLVNQNAILTLYRHPILTPLSALDLGLARRSWSCDGGGSDPNAVGVRRGF